MNAMETLKFKGIKLNRLNLHLVRPKYIMVYYYPTIDETHATAIYDDDHLMSVVSEYTREVLEL